VRIDAGTQVCAVIGNPVEHSLSPLIHNAAFEATGLNYVYVAFRVEDVAGCLAGMRALPSWRGLSVTIPHKVAVMPYLDDIDPMAARVGCVNTVTNEGGRLIGAVTDGLGTLRAFNEAGVSLEGKRVLFLGSGGAVRAVAFAILEHAGPECVTVLGRNPERLATLVDDLRAHARVPVVGGSIEEDAPEAAPAHDVIIQGTPVGMHPHSVDETCVARESLRPEHVVFDMVYRPSRTRLIAEAEAVGCTTILGLEMLVNQAALQFETWTGVAAPRTVMRDVLVARLEKAETGNEATAEER